jgi:hypothetical protein
MVQKLVYTVKVHSDDPHLKIFISLQVIWALAIPPIKGKLEHLSVGINGIKTSFDRFTRNSVLFLPYTVRFGIYGKEQYGENQHGAWMNVMKVTLLPIALCCSYNRIGLEQYLPDTAGIQFLGFFFVLDPEKTKFLAQPQSTRGNIDC